MTVYEYAFSVVPIRDLLPLLFLIVLVVLDILAQLQLPHLFSPTLQLFKASSLLYLKYPNLSIVMMIMYSQI